MLSASGKPVAEYFMFHGTGGNGKSVLMEWVLRMPDQLATRVSSRGLRSETGSFCNPEG